VKPAAPRTTPDLDPLEAAIAEHWRAGGSITPSTRT
jgi:hypothetical protein